MLELINVKRHDNIIEANYIPEGTQDIGYIKMDLNTNEIIDNIDTPYDENCFQGMLIQAAYALPRIADDKPFKEIYTHSWY